MQMQDSTHICLKRFFARGAVLVMCVAAVCNLAACNEIEEPAPSATGTPTIPTQVIEPPGISTEAPEHSDTLQQSGLTIDPNAEPPLDAAALSIAVPDFLTVEQQDLYRRAYCMYIHMFASSTENIDLIGETDLEVFNSRTKTEIDGRIYMVSSGRYKNWNDFDAVIHALFTDDFWNRINGDKFSDGTVIPFYAEKDGKLCYESADKGIGYYYNENFPDEFRLEEQNEQSIFFTLIGHYSPVWPNDDETGEERDIRRAQEYEYTLEFPMRMVLTDGGWRFDEFHSALVDEEEQ